MKGEMMQKSTQAKIIEIMENKQIASITDLASQLGVTNMTIRRNLDSLQEMGFVKRERGYAYLTKAAQKTDYYIESSEHAKEKSAIARAAFSYIVPSTSVCIDSGTTTQALIELLPDHIELSVLTPSLTGALALSSKENIQVAIPGGFLDHSNRSLLLTNPDELKHHHVDYAFLSCRSFRPPEGAFELTPSLATTKEALSDIADVNILLADYSKWGANSLCNTLPLEKIDIIITDSKAPSNLVKICRDAGKTVIIAD